MDIIDSIKKRTFSISYRTTKGDIRQLTPSKSFNIISKEEKEKSSRYTTIYQAGTCFAIDSKHLLTAHHVIKEAEEGIFELKSPYHPTIKARELVSDPKTDLALLQLVGYANLDLEPCSIDITPKMGDELLWGGYPLLIGEYSNPPTRLRICRGIVSSEIYEENQCAFFEIDGTINPSHSGSPVFSVETKKFVGLAISIVGTPEDTFYEIMDFTRGFPDLVDIVPDILVGKKDAEIKRDFWRTKKVILFLEQIINATYQMGLGVVIGGETIIDFLSKNGIF